MTCRYAFSIILVGFHRTLDIFLNRFGTNVPEIRGIFSLVQKNRAKLRIFDKSILMYNEHGVFIMTVAIVLPPTIVFVVTSPATDQMLTSPEVELTGRAAVYGMAQTIPE